MLWLYNTMKKAVWVDDSCLFELCSVTIDSQGIRRKIMVTSLCGPQPELTLYVLRPLQERKLACIHTNVHVIVFILTWAWLIFHVLASRGVMVARSEHLVICISGGWKAKRVVVSLRHYCSVLLEIKARWFLVGAWIRDFYTITEFEWYKERINISRLAKGGENRRIEMYLQ